ncbi:helix-turn-helix domain-containing protein [Pseudonocardia sp. EC080625-04]|uniref:helix-turn-helix domain-containing protein n=1 Tax=Pseudonocardia sp. EC080625-04 TaxID=1096868 RepID=UPI0014389A11|nr:helix-turn-helix domain-containing protein [Pseudonocardia sp. EC080625-04]
MIPSKRSGDVDRFSNGLPVRELGRRVREARQRHGLILQDLADAAGVSRSMLSEIERGAKMPTVLVLDRVAGALGSSVAQLLDEHRNESAVVIREDDQRVEAENGWTWRLLSPALPGRSTQFVRVVAPPNSDGPEFPAHVAGSREWLALERGRLRVVVGSEVVDLEAGDAVSFVGDVGHRISNPGAAEAMYFLVTDYSAP